VNNLYQTVMSDPDGAPYLPQFLMRDALLSELLGNDKGDISYWAGKALARRFPVGSPKDAQVFFKQAGFGDLTLLKQTADMTQWQLSGEPVKLHKELDTAADFTLEAGFLAEMMAQQLGVLTEAEPIETPRKLRSNTVTFAVYSHVLFAKFLLFLFSYSYYIKKRHYYVVYYRN